MFDPSDPGKEAVVLYDRNYQDSYSDPGQFVTKENKYGRNVLDIEKNSVFLLGDGYTEEGQFPFVDKLSLKTLETKRIYQSEYTDKIENLISFKPEKDQLLVRIESPTEYPNYYSGI